jgi:pimeloyl-ACP methyl ester carboxylesterase
MTTQFRFFDLPHLRMHSAVAGPETGPLVVLLHGFPEFWYSWRHQVPALAAAGFRVVAPDQRGYNLTDKTPPYDIGTLSQDIADLIHACRREQAHVAGHDWGAAVAWALAASHPEAVSRLAILNVPHPAVMVRNLFGGNWRQVARSWYIAFFQVPALPEWLMRLDRCRGLKQLLVRTARPGTFTPADLERYEMAWAQPGALPGMVGWYRAAAQAAFSRRLPARPEPISAPTLILWGENDVALGVELAEQSLAYTSAGRLVRFSDATHWVHQDCPAETTRQLLEHFAAGQRGAVRRSHGNGERAWGF